MNREHLKTGISLVCAVVPIVAALVIWAAPDLPVGETVTTQVSAVLQSALVLMGFRFVRTTSLPEGLALGYFWSFVEPLATGLPNKPEVVIDGDSYPSDRVRIEIRVPESIESSEENPVGLAELRADLEKLPEASIDTGQHGLRTVRVQKFAGEGETGVTIIDVPRTLDVLERTLTRELGVEAEGRRRKIGDRELGEFSARLERSFKEQRGSYFRDQVSISVAKQ